MKEFKNWKEFINQVLIESGQFENPKTEFKEDTEIESYKSTNRNSLTIIEVGYIKDNLLIYLHVFNPTIPGYNKFKEGEYFNQHDFDEEKNYGFQALEFNEQNLKGILSILKEGLGGKEIQFIKDGEVLKSNLKLLESSFYPDINHSYDFTNRSFWKKMFGEKIQNMSGIEKKEIELNKIFSGIKNVLQHRI
ncbi:hypothetical protein ES731_15205 [Psychroflexus gondwanensis]|nr:hypothetical protein ES731_15205 [Psychroflexus gondwanensis]